MKADAAGKEAVAPTCDSNLLVGQFVRKQGQYGTIAVVARAAPNGLEIIADPKKMFGRDGVVETQGIVHTGLNAGDWVEFDTQKNSRFRAPEYKAVHLRRLPRFAVLHEATLDEYRVLLTKDGWRGDRRPGLWALQISDDKILVVELEASKDGALRLSRSSARDVQWHRFDQRQVHRPRPGDDAEQVFLAPPGAAEAAFDWSDEADYIGRVIKSLAGHSDSRVTEIITWLELHYEEATGKVSAAASEQGAALEALRSGALARRLRADRQLMQSYLDAAIENEAVRDAVAEFAREGETAERERMRLELAEELEAERTKRLSVIDAEMSERKAAAEKAFDEEIAKLAAKSKQSEVEREIEARRNLEERLEDVEATFDARKSQLVEEIARRGAELAKTISSIENARSELARTQAESENAGTHLTEVKQEIDRLLAIQDRLAPPSAPVAALGLSKPVAGIAFSLPNLPVVPPSTKRNLINGEVMLSDVGKDRLRGLLVLALSGEVPILSGGDAEDFLRVAEAIVCPRRYVAIEADPTLISIDDLWSRPGSGAPTLLAAAADAAQAGGTVLVVIKGIEQSGARYWLPALVDTLRNGGLPRGLLICCTVRDRDHEELKAILSSHLWLDLENAIAPDAAAAAPTLMTPPWVNLESLDPGLRPDDLSDANGIILKLSGTISIGVAMRVARIFVEAKFLLGDDSEVERLVLQMTKSLTDKVDR